MALVQQRLANGLNVFFWPRAEMQSVALELMMQTGSSQETAAEAGLAHFLEHLVFRGTKKWPQYWQISRRLDALGGVANAYTDKAETAYWLKVLPTNLRSGLEILAQLVIDPLFQAADIERERGVIIEELRMYHDRPISEIEDFFEQQIFGRGRLGRPVLGRLETIKKFTPDHFRAFHRRWYRAGRASLALVGKIKDLRRAQAWVEEFFSPLPAGRPPQPRLQPRPARQPLRQFPRPVKQAHLMVGVPLAGFATPVWQRRLAAVLLTVLAGGFNSRLNRKIRQQRGWAYYLYGLRRYYRRAGYLAIKAGIRRDRWPAAVAIIRRELTNLAASLKQAEFQRACQAVLGRVLFDLENNVNLASLLNRSWLFEKKIVEPKLIEEQYLAIREMEKGKVVKFSQQLFAEAKNYRLAVIRPKNEG